MKKIAVIGSGSAGSATALFLNRYGFDVTIFEREQKPRPVGAGFMLQLTGLQVIEELNVLKKVQNLAHPIYKVQGSNNKGHSVLDLDFRKVDKTFSGMGMHRGTFFSLLHTEIKKESIPLVTGAEIQETVQNSHGTFLVNQDNRKIGPFDLVVVANGASSKLREKYSITKKSKKQEWGAAWAVLPKFNNEYDNSIYQVYSKTQKMLGLMPIGKKEEYSNDEFINLFWSIRMDKVDKWKKAGIEYWKKDILNLDSTLTELTENLHSFDQIMSAPYYDVKLSPYFKDKVVFIGDSAHAMSPQLSCGVNNALLDAQALSFSLSQTKNTNLALDAFFDLRKRHNQFYQNLCRILTPFFQSDLPLATIRDLVIGKFFKHPLATRLMVENTLGIRESLLRRLPSKYYYQLTK